MNPRDKVLVSLGHSNMMQDRVHTKAGGYNFLTALQQRVRQQENMSRH